MYRWPVCFSFVSVYMGEFFLMWGSRKYPYPHHRGSLEILRRRGVLKAIFLEESMSLNWNFQRGGGEFKPKNPLLGEYRYLLECQHNENYSTKYFPILLSPLLASLLQYFDKQDAQSQYSYPTYSCHLFQLILVFVLCIPRKYPYPPPWMVIGNSKGVGTSKAKIF